MAHELQVRYASLVDAKLRLGNPISTHFFNTNYIGNPKAGSVKIPVTNDVVVEDYDRVNGMEAKGGSTTYQSLLIDNDKAIYEVIDGYEAEAVPYEMVGYKLNDGAYALGRTFEQFYVNMLKTSATEINTLVQVGDTAYAQVLVARTELSNAGVPQEGRKLAVSPEFFALLLLDPNFIKQGDLAQSKVEQGVLGRVAGFDVYESTDLGDVNFIASHPQNSHKVLEWDKMPYIETLTNGYIGASALKGRMVYGGKVTKAETVLKCTAVATPIV